MKKIKVGLLFGGQSAEHAISLVTARAVVAALDKTQYDPVLLAITKTGDWLLMPEADFVRGAEDAGTIKLAPTGSPISLRPGGTVFSLNERSLFKLDVIFPLLHGPYGEDGTVQGLLQLANIPYVGSGVLGSAVCMDKDVCKRLLRDAGLPITDFVVVSSKLPLPSDQAILAKVGLPCFVKPSNMGSSVGVIKVKRQEDLRPAIQQALAYDVKVLIERAVVGREIECALLGNWEPEASILGEIIPQHEFYTYEAKYLDPQGAALVVPAELPPSVVEKVQALARQAFMITECFGMARIDFFVTKEASIVINEINTIPGFTPISMYPKLWQASGLTYSSLLARLIQLGIERFETMHGLQLEVLDAQTTS